jgi:hypothetical protein
MRHSKKSVKNWQKNEAIKFYFWQGTIKGEILIYCNFIGENFDFFAPRRKFFNFLTPIGEIAKVPRKC